MSRRFRKAKDIIWKILNVLEIGGPIELRKEGGLKNDGWFKSFKMKKSLDASGNPIPWFTYSSLKFIETRISENLTVFEYGSGSSTLWFSERVGKITSVEHHEGWFNHVKKTLPNNCELHFVKDVEGKNYSHYIEKLNNQYDVIIIDGIDRVNCCKIAPEYLTNQGVIIFDNSNRLDYEEGKKYLFTKGFKEIFFYGNAPVVSIYSCTSIFYKDENVFNI
ncbi:MAG: hypothetical protein SCALA702_25450 [Melioribacteraceae bacterium]|nr:MAG: hypothetical protein SCALA702_25450 [Melioribacteraceae bacterium]